MLKHTSGVCAVGSKLVQRKEQLTSDCPHYGEHETLATCGFVKNQQSSLSGCYSCPPLANDSSRFILPKTSPTTGSFSISPNGVAPQALLSHPVQHARASPDNRYTRWYQIFCFLQTMHCCQMGKGTRGRLPLAWLTQHWQAMGYLFHCETIGSRMGSLGSLQPGQDACRNYSGHRSPSRDNASRMLGICLRPFWSPMTGLAPLQMPSSFSTLSSSLHHMDAWLL